MNELRNETYFSPAMIMKYLSASQFKNFEDCEARALAELNGEWITEKDCFLEGNYFEACLNGAEELFLSQHPEMVSSRGPIAGEIKANYKKVKGAVEAFKKQKMFMNLISECEQQVIVTGEIAGIPFKGKIDFLNMQTFDEYDTKAMANFKKIWSNVDNSYVNWYFGYGYHYQASIYRELIQQTYGKSGKQYIIASTKEDIPDIKGLYFTNEILDNALEIIKEFAPRYAAIKRGEIDPIACGHCDYCKSNKIITKFDIVGEYE